MNKCIQHLIPQPCPFELIRIGGEGDGAYLVPDDLDGIAACFSPGVNNFKDFEDELATQYGITCHMCDFTSDLRQFRTPLIEGMQTFKKKWLDINGEPDSISLQEWIEECSPNPHDDLILQIDIEGAEYRNLLAADERVISRFRIIVIEMHGLHALRNQELASRELEPLLQKLNRAHTCVHAHPNNCCGEHLDAESGLNIPNVIELTYLRKDRFTGDKTQYIKPQLPHPLDIGRNVRSLPPIHLNNEWLSSGRSSAESQLKVLSDNLDYEKWKSHQLTVSNSKHLEELLKTFRQSINNFTRFSQVNTEIQNLDSLAENRLDLAHGRRFSLSAAYGSYPTEGIIKEDPKFFFHTALGRDQSITVDFGESLVLQYLVIGNRGDGCQDRAGSLFVIVHDDKQYSVTDALPVLIPEQFIVPNGPPSITPLFGQKGRFLTIFSPIYTSLHFSSIKVF